MSSSAVSGNSVANSAESTAETLAMNAASEAQVTAETMSTQELNQAVHEASVAKAQMQVTNKMSDIVGAVC